MDPNATWQMLMDAYIRREWADVLVAAEALLEWLDRGGFPPDAAGDKAVGWDWNRAMTESACRFARDQAAQAIAAPQGIPGDCPFTLTCYFCDAAGPETFEAAFDEGWREIEFVPNGLSSNFLGRCPIHRDHETDA